MNFSQNSKPPIKEEAKPPYQTLDLPEQNCKPRWVISPLQRNAFANQLLTPSFAFYPSSHMYLQLDA